MLPIILDSEDNWELISYMDEWNITDVFIGAERLCMVYNTADGVQTAVPCDEGHVTLCADGEMS